MRSAKSQLRVSPFLVKKQMQMENTAAALAIADQSAEAIVRRHIAVGIEIQNLCFVNERYQRSLPVAMSTFTLSGDKEIYGKGEEAVLFFKLVLGMVRTCTFLKNGRRQIDAFYLPGNVFGLEVGAEHNLTAETVCRSRVISYRRRDLEVLATNSERFSAVAFSFAMQSLARAQEHAVLLGCRSAVEKLATFLTDLAAYSPKSEMLSLEMSRRDIADYLGLTIETVSRAFGHLVDKSLIDLSTARQIRLKDPEGLRLLTS
jgi:CRP/FNR family nitrogen fixation transcriptional regulator